MIEVACKVKVYEIDGKDIEGATYPTLEIMSDWAYNSRVILVVDGRKFTVYGPDLEMALKNAMNKGSR